MIARLVEAHDRMAAAGGRVAAVGPRYTDARHNNPPPFIRFEGLRLVRCRQHGHESVVAVDYLVSSGCLMPMRTLAEVGDMNADLFIDYVDIEWGLRAKSRGYQSFGAFDATMTHHLGEDPLSWFGRSVPLHSPTRHYYLFRNAVWLYGQPWPPRNWKVVDAWRLLLKFGFYALYAAPRWRHVTSMLAGVRDGLRGRMGPRSGGTRRTEPVAGSP